MRTRKDFVAGLDNKFVALIIKPLAIVIGDGSGFFQRGIGRDHLTGNQIFPDAEML
jgi:hypothetical protein